MTTVMRTASSSVQPGLGRGNASDVPMARRGRRASSIPSPRCLQLRLPGKRGRHAAAEPQMVHSETVESAAGGAGGGRKASGGGGGGGGGGGRTVGREGTGGGGERGGMGAYYREMLEADPENPLLLRNYGKFLHEVQGDVERAEEFYARAVLASPGDGEVLSLYGKLIWDARRDEDRAGAYFERAVEASPDDCYVLGAYAHFLWDAEAEEERTSPASAAHSGQPREPPGDQEQTLRGPARASGGAGARTINHSACSVRPAEL